MQSAKLSWKALNMNMWWMKIYASAADFAPVPAPAGCGTWLRIHRLDERINLNFMLQFTQMY
jgi:hypothetical protein